MGAEAIRNTLQPALNGLNDLNPPADPSQPEGLWAWPLGYTVSWDDSDSPDLKPNRSTDIGWGYGKQAPPADSSSNVLNYAHVLPAYLYCVSVVVSIGALIDPNFKQDYSDSVITPAAGLLKSLHDYIVSQGLNQLAPSEPVNTESLNGWFSNKSFTPGVTVA